MGRCLIGATVEDHMRLKHSTLLALASMLASGLGVLFLLFVVLPMEPSAKAAWTLWSVPMMGLSLFGLLGWALVEQGRERAAR